MKEVDQERAIENYKPKPPRKYELGGDYYYRCYWVSCNEILKKWYRYCPSCGSRIDWGKDEYL